MKTLILTDGPLNASATERLTRGDLLAAIAGQPGISFQYRLRAGQLDLRRGRPFLCSPDASGLLHLLDRNGRITAFSTAPEETLSALDGQVFHIGEHQRVRIRYSAAGSAAYAPRLVQLIADDVAPLMGLHATTDFSNQPDGESAMLFFDPWWIDGRQLATADRLMRWLARYQPGPRDSNVLILPPVELESNRKGIHLAEFRSVRERLWHHWQPEGPRPALLTIAELHDHPRLEDLLAEGAQLWLTGSSGQPTRALLTTCAAPKRGIARYRTDFLQGDEFAGPSWSRQVARAVRGDLESLANHGVSLQKGTLHSFWDPLLNTAYAEGGTEHGACAVLKQLADRLPSDLRRTFLSKVIEPACRPGGRPDHDLAERRCLTFLVGASWPSHEAFEDWRSAFFTELIDGLTSGLSPDWWLDSLRATGSEARHDGCNWLVSHPPRLPESVLRVQRLLAPLGTVFSPDLCPRLDKVCLDAGYNLA